mgnify:CR=1 FL=1|jgi:uncharacterized YigZ family protein
MDHYKTVKGQAEVELRERSSRFFGYAMVCASEEQLKAQLSVLKKAHPTARHFCYGAVFGAEVNESRSSDAGEPSGTAGLPILNQILSFKLTNVLVVVVRYFGGTKLGKPGLIAAYKESTKMVLETATIVTEMVTACVEVDFDYEDTGAVMLGIEKFVGSEIQSQTYLERCTIQFSVPKSTLSNALLLFDHLQNVHVRPCN